MSEQKWFHLEDYPPFLADDDEGQRQNSYGPFDTVDECFLDWKDKVGNTREWACPLPKSDR